jgi:RNA polymerase sigma-70 factor (ECF subfamily)
VTTALAMDNTAARAAETLSREAFDEFYNRTARALRSYICRVSGSATLADDILQESYIRLLNAPPLEEAQRKSYLYRTATNLITDHRRAQSRRRRWWQLTAPVAEAVASPVEVTSDVERLFARLAPQERALLWLAYVDGASHREIAGVLGLKEASVKVLLFRARRKMEALLREHGFEGMP